MMGYTVVGGDGLLRGVPRTATVIAEEPSVVYRLTQGRSTRCRPRPGAAAVLHKLIIRLPVRPARIRQSRDLGAALG